MAENSTPTLPTALADLPWLPFLDEAGQLPTGLERTIGAFAVFDRDRTLQYVSYSRDLGLSLRQCLVRCPEACHWVKVQPIERPSRAVLEGICAAWLAAAMAVPVGNGAESDRWGRAIDAKATITPEDQTALDGAIDDHRRGKILKQIARRQEATIQEQLAARGVGFEIRFNPKLKEQGLLDLT
jgi:hypothetical protein